MKSLPLILSLLFAIMIFAGPDQAAPRIYTFDRCETFLYNSAFDEEDFDNYDIVDRKIQVFIWQSPARIRIKRLDDNTSTEYSVTRLRDLRFSKEVYISDSLYYYLTPDAMVEYRITPNIHIKKIYKKSEK